VVEADLVLHVRDIAHSETDAQARDVATVLSGLGVDTAPVESRVVEVWNKIDLMSPVTRDEALNAARFREAPPLAISARTGDGVDDLLAAIDERLGRGWDIVTLSVPAEDGRFAHWLHENAEVLERRPGPDGEIAYRVRVDAARKGRLMALLKGRGD